jgi:hypothetical protein
MFSEVNLNLNITNNVDYPVQINILGNPYNLLDTSNATTEYQYDLTSFVFTSENEVTIQYKLNSAASFSTYSGSFSNPTLQSVVDVLNNLGIGFFSVYSSGGNTYIGTYNDDYTFGQLSLYNSATAQVSYQITQPNAGGSGLINGVSFTLPYTTPITVPVTPVFGGSFPGQTIFVSGTTQSVANTDVIITETSLQTFQSTIIYNVNYAPLSVFSTSFVAQLSYSYLIQII